MEKNEMIEHQCGVMTNAAYLMSLALDLILRTSERMMRVRSESYKKEKKQLFTRYEQAVKTACILQDQLTQDIWDIEQKYDYKNVDLWLGQANELARLILLFADHSTEQETVDKIFSYVRSLPGEGIIDEKLLESFYLR